MTRTLVHDRLTSIPAPGESPEVVVEHAIVSLWQLRIAEQLIWLDHKTYADQETKAIVKQHYGTLSHESIAFLDLLLKDCVGVEAEIRATPSNNSYYARKGGRQAKDQINPGRLMRYLRDKFDLNKTKAERVFAELEDFTTTLLTYAAA